MKSFKFISFIHCVVYRHVYSPFLSLFSRESDLVLPITVHSILSFPQVSPVAAYVFFIVFPKILSFSDVSEKANSTQGVTNATRVAFFFYSV